MMTSNMQKMNQDEIRLLEAIAPSATDDSTANCMKEENFNTDDLRQSVPTQRGLLFYVGSKLKDLTVTGIEVGIRSIAIMDGNLGIQLFASNQTYDENNLDPAAFELIADVQMVQNPDNPDTALIPAHAMKPLILPRLTRTTLLFRAAGPWLDYKLEAMTKAKDQATSNNRMVVFAGNVIPMDTPDNVPIPTALDTSLNSIFLGNFYLELQRDNCGADPKPNIITTDVQFLHVVNATLAAPDYNNIEEKVNTEVDNLLMNDDILAQYSREYNMKMPDSSKAFFQQFQGKCVDNTWDVCNYVVTELSIKHYDTISEGLVKQAFMRHAKSFAGIIEAQFLPNVAYYYLGYELVQGNFKFVLDGVPANTQMDSVQTDFFSEQVMSFLNIQFPDIYAEVYDVQVAAQKPSRRRLASGDTAGRMELTGTISGGQIAVLQNADFATRIDSVFQSAGAAFQSAVQYNVYMPGPMAQNERYTYFQGLKSTTSSTTPNNNGIVEIDSGCSTCAPKPTSDGSSSGGGGGGGSSSSDSSSSGGMSMIMLIGIGAGAVALAVILCVYCCYCRKSNKKKKPTKISADDQYKKVKTVPDKIYMDDPASKTQATTDLSVDTMDGSLTPTPKKSTVPVRPPPLLGSHSRSIHGGGMGNQPQRQVPARSASTGQKASYKLGQQPQQHKPAVPPRFQQSRSSGKPVPPPPPPAAAGGQAYGSPAPPSVRKPRPAVSDDRQAPGSDYGNTNTARPLDDRQAPGSDYAYSAVRPSVGPRQGSNYNTTNPAAPLSPAGGPSNRARGPAVVAPFQQGQQQQPRRASAYGPAAGSEQESRQVPGLAPQGAMQQQQQQPPRASTVQSAKPGYAGESPPHPPKPLHNPWAQQQQQQANAPVVNQGQQPINRRGSLVAATGWSRDGQHPAQTPMSNKASVGAAIATNEEGIPFIPATPQTIPGSPMHPRQGRHSSPQRSMVEPMTPMSTSQSHIYPAGMRNYDDSSQRSFSYNTDMLFSPERRGSNMSMAHRRGSNFSNLSHADRPIAHRRGSNLSVSERRDSNLSIPPSPLHAPTSRRVSGSYSNNLFIPPESPLHAPTSRRQSASYSTRTASWSPVRASRKQSTSASSPAMPRRSVSTGRRQSTSFPEAPPMGPQGRAAVKNSMAMAIVANTSSSPAFTRQELERMSVRDLKQLLPHDDKFQPVDKKDLVDHLIEIGAVELISCYKMSTLQQMSIAQLRKCLKESGVQFDPRFVAEKRDMIRVFQASGKLQVLPEDDFY